MAEDREHAERVVAPAFDTLTSVSERRPVRRALRRRPSPSLGEPPPSPMDSTATTEDDVGKAAIARYDLRALELYLNRELSWLQFNRRVLHEAQDARTPLLERVKFLAIVNSNLDEFFMKRIGGLKQQAAAGVSEVTVDGRTPTQQIAECLAFLRGSRFRDRRDIRCAAAPPGGRGPSARPRRARLRSRCADRPERRYRPHR